MQELKAIRNDCIKDYITPPDAVLHDHFTVSEAVEHLSRCQMHNDTQYIYSIDQNGVLDGVLSTRSLLFSPKEAPIANLMLREPIAIQEEETIENALRKLLKHRLLALPVVNQNNQLQGVFEITKSQGDNLSKGSNYNDIFQLVGFSLEELRADSTFGEFKRRLPWLFCNIAGGLSCAFISTFFDDVLSQVVAISFFIPLVLTLSESVSMQSTSISIQFLHFRGINWKKVIKRSRKEIRLALLLGLACGAIVGLIILLSQEGLEIALILASAIFTSMLFGVLFGSIVPIALHAFKLDPKIASGPVVLTLTDVITTMIYLSIATYWLIG